jgi:3-deoxy-D-manno-octulosonate 8-phosphate phosphatase (KDO 8-P phosphatase)
MHIRPTMTTCDPRPVRLLALDVDGVLTDGSIMLDDHGVETKRFSIRDGQGLTTWLRLGLDVAIITKRSGKALEHRCRELGISRVMQGAKDKSAALDDVMALTRVPAEEIAYIGDDWPDLPVLRRVGLPICVADSASQVLDEVRGRGGLITSLRGGHGAVREAIEFIFRGKDMMDQALAIYR